jgi:hypothetical protein
VPSLCLRRTGSLRKKQRKKKRRKRETVYTDLKLQNQLCVCDVFVAGNIINALVRAYNFLYVQSEGNECACYVCVCEPSFLSLIVRASVSLSLVSRSSSC